jgi:hypothetical protein
MIRTLSLVAVLGLCALPAPADAADPPGRRAAGRRAVRRGDRVAARRATGAGLRPAYVRRYGVPFGYGYYYRGLAHRQWTRAYFWRAYNAWTYYDPYTLRWYYWHPARRNFYPVVYIRVAPPPPVVTMPIPDVPIRPPVNGDPGMIEVPQQQQ